MEGQPSPGKTTDKADPPGIVCRPNELWRQRNPLSSPTPIDCRDRGSEEIKMRKRGSLAVPQMSHSRADPSQID